MDYLLYKEFEDRKSCSREKNNKRDLESLQNEGGEKRRMNEEKGKIDISDMLFSCQVVSNTVIPWTEPCQTFLSFTISWSLLELMSIELVMLSNHLILCRPLLSPSVFPSIRVFSNELAFRISWPKYCGFSFRKNPSNEYSGVISFRMD